MTDKPTPTTDLLKRCAEIHEWRSTGLLSGEALRDYAKRKWSGRLDTLQMAEHETVTEALALLAKWGQLAQAAEPVAVVVPCYTPSGKRVALCSAKQDLPIGTKLYTAPQPSPTTQADSQPAPVEVADAMADSQYLAGVSAGWNAANADDPNAALQKLQESRAGYLKPLRAARAQADSVTAPVGGTGNLEQELAMMIRRIVSSARRNCEDGSNVLKLANEAWVYLVRKGLNGSPLRDAGIESDPTPPAQAADSVLEDAGGANWQDISTAPKDGTRFVAAGNNYGLYSEAQHTCIAQWFRDCWIEASDWNEISELKYLTHWMPLLPLPGSAEMRTQQTIEQQEIAPLTDEELCQIEEPHLVNFRIPLGGQYDFARDVEKAVLAKTRGMQATTPPAQAADSVLKDAARLERERICAAIKAEDDYCVDQGDYMLDSDDCIKIVRGEWVRPDFAIDTARKQGGST